MKFLDKSKINLKELWLLFITFAIPLVGVGGASALPYRLRIPLIYSIGIALVLAFVLTDIKISFNPPNLIFATLLTYIGITMPFSLHQETTMSLFLIYLSCFPLLFLNLSLDNTQKIVSVIYIFCLVIAISIFISVPIDQCMNRFFWFIVNPSRAANVAAKMQKQLNLGGFAGFAVDIGEAAFIMNSGVAISFADYFAKGHFTKKNLLSTLAFLVALTLTGKRTYFIVAIICFFAFMIVSRVKGKIFKISATLLLAIVAVFFIVMFIPSMANIFYRLADVENISDMGGRDSLWKYVYMMIDEFPVFGGGFGAYNEYAYVHGMRTYDQRWDYNAHNSYLQVLGELGVVGFSLVILFMVTTLIITIRLIRKLSAREDKNVNLLYYSMYIQIMTMVYSLTGNPLYTKQYILTWIFAIGVMLNLYGREKEKKSPPRLTAEFNKFV